MFAKLFNDTPHGQILAKMGTNEDDEAELRFYWERDGLCLETALSFGANQELQKELFEKTDEAAACAVVESVEDSWGKLGLNIGDVPHET